MIPRKILGFAAFAAVVFAAGAIAATLGAFSSTSRSAAPAGGESIKLHGQWTIKIRDHGRIVRTAYFHNDFVAPGKLSLLRFLNRMDFVGDWSVGIGPQLCNAQVNVYTSCLAEQQSGDGAKIDCGSLPEQCNLGAQFYPVDVQLDDVNYKLVLTTQITPNHSGTIAEVFTQLRRCSNSLIHCDGSDRLFTLRYLDTPIPVTAGQQVLITVKIAVT